MSDKPELHQLTLALDGLTWGEVMSMAVQLRMDFSKLEEIEHQNSEPKSRLQTSMHAWLETDSEASWKRVVGALGAIKKNELALELEKKYCNPAACSADTTTGNATLIRDSALYMLGELLKARNHSEPLGRELKVPAYTVSGIHSQYPDLSEHLYYVLVEFLKQVEPTWGAIVNALKSSAVNLPCLALTIENRHCLHIQQDQPPQARSLRSKPAQPELLNFKTRSGSSINIVEQIGEERYIELGVNLLNDNKGAKTKEFVDRNHSTVHMINWNILTEWCQGQGKMPVQWSTLVDVLREIGLSVLAGAIEDSLDDGSSLSGSTVSDSPGIMPLPETKEDADEMKETFKKLDYDIHQLQNEKATKDAVTTLVKKLSAYLQRYYGGIDDQDGRRKSIIFAFSGHGNDAGNIKMNDGKLLHLKEQIVLPLVRHGAVFYIPKLFFIDACRGSDHIKGDSGRLSVRDNLEKGFKEVEGNYRIEYATIGDHVAYVGSRWMILLAQKLRTDESYQNIIAEVNRMVNEQMQHRQQCESTGRLNTGPLYLRQKPHWCTWI